MLTSQHVVDQTREDYLGGISDKTDRPAVHPVHALLHVPEHMFHPRPSLGMCLVAIELLTALLRPSRVRVLVALLVGLVFFVILRVPLFRIPELVSFSLFDELVLLTAVALARHLHKTAVDDNLLIHNQIVVPEVLVELVEQCVKKPFLRQLFSEHPYSPCIGHPVAAGQTEEVAERQSVTDLVLCLFVADVA